MSYAALRFRPMGVGDLLDETINLYRSHLVLLAKIAGVLLVPLAAVQLLVAPTPLFVPNAGMIGVGLFIVILNGFVSLLVSGALVLAISDICLGRPVTVRDAYRAAMKRYWSIIGLAFLIGLAVAAMGLTVIGIPFAIYFGVGWSLAYQTLLIEQLGIRRGMSRSRSLVRGTWWRVLGILLLIGLFTSIIGWVFSIPSGIILGVSVALKLSGPVGFVLRVLEVLLGAAQQVVITPVSMTGFVLLYYDLRVRKEGFDLEMQAREIDAFSPPGSSIT